MVSDQPVVMNCMLCPVSYDAIRQAMNGKPFPMSLTSKKEIAAVIRAVNQGIDSYLEACYCPSRGDRYGQGDRRVGDIILTSTLECNVSVESLPTLLRRLSEDEDEAGMDLANCILTVLGFNDYGRYVGRDDD